VPRIEITQGDYFFERKGAMSGFGVRVLADGKDLEELRSVHVKADLDSIVTVTVEQNVTEGWSFKHDGVRLVVKPFLLPNGYKLRMKLLEDGVVEYMAVPLSFDEVQEVNG
jgi:hypothetical protein